MKLEDQIQSIKKALREGQFTSEAAVSQGAVMPVLNTLGWPVFETSIVIPEFSLEGRRVDYALCHPASKPAVFVEVKKVGFTDGADRQLFEYAFHAGVPMAILTDGQEWSFYLPAAQGNYDERRVYKLDLLERNIEEIVARMERYLNYSAVCSGDALEAAQSDYKNVARNREIKSALPQAWDALLGEPDSLLAELLADKVEDICGYKPDLDICGDYLVKFGAQYEDNQLNQRTTSIYPRQTNNKTSKGNKARSRKQGKYSFSVGGKQYEAGSAKDAMIKVFSLLAEADSQFPERFAARKHGKKRRYLSRDRTELYPDRPDLAEIASVEVLPGWWLGTNYSRRDIQKIIDLAKEVVDPVVSDRVHIQVDD